MAKETFKGRIYIQNIKRSTGVYPYVNLRIPELNKSQVERLKKLKGKDLVISLNIPKLHH